MGEMHPDMKNDFTLIGSTMPAIITSLAKTSQMAKAAGFNLKDCGVVLNYEGEASYVPFAEKIKQCGAKGMWTSRSPVPNEFNFFKAVDQAVSTRSSSVRPPGTPTRRRRSTRTAVCSTT